MQKITCRIPLNPTSRIRLDEAILQAEEVRSAHLSRALVRKLLVAGAVYVNGKRVRLASREMLGGEVIDIYWDKERTPERLAPDQFLKRILPLSVIYQDEALLCFNKPAGLPTQPTVDETRANLYELGKEQLSRQSEKSIYLGMHHRLDRDTSGVVLFTLAQQYNAFVADQFKNHKCTKVYAALVHGRLKNPKGRVESFLSQVGKKGKQARFGSVRSGGKKAITDFLVLAQNDKYSLVEVRITTGRTHQIRVHFSEMGHSIVGDTLYGSPEVEYRKRGRFLLHAHALTIEHPVTHNSLRIESPLPPEFRL